MSEGKVTTERRGHVLLIGLDRAAKRNAFDIAIYHSLALAYGTLDRDPDLRCGVLFAHGDHFTGGIDLAQWSPSLKDGNFPPLPEDAKDPLALREEHRLRKPLVLPDFRKYAVKIDFPSVPPPPPAAELPGSVFPVPAYAATNAATSSRSAPLTRLRGIGEIASAIWS